MIVLYMLDLFLSKLTKQLCSFISVKLNSEYNQTFTIYMERVLNKIHSHNDTASVTNYINMKHMTNSIVAQFQLTRDI